MPASTVEGKIEDALFAHLDAFTPAIPTSYPNRDFTPPASGKYLRATHQPNRSFQATLGDAGTNRLQGILQVDVFDRENAGSLPSREMAGALIAHFKRGTRLDAGGGLVVRVNAPPYAVAPIQNNGWLQTPVTITYFADAPNP
jgi:hypothetical protein